MKGLLVAALLAALAGGGYFGWTKYDEGVKAREAQQAEERARLEKSAEEHIARLKAEKDKVEAEKRKIEAEREKQMNEEAKRKKEVERERNEKDRKIKALSVAEDEVEVCKNRINSILRGDFRAQGGLKDDWQGFDAGMITMIDATVSVVEEPHWKRIAQDLSADNHVDTIDDASAIVQKELKRLKGRLKEITRVKRVYDAKELESRKERCRSCGGSKRVTCLRCNGKGMVRVAGEDCSACDGRGFIYRPKGETKSPPRKKDGDGEKKILVH